MVSSIAVRCYSSSTVDDDIDESSPIDEVLDNLYIGNQYFLSFKTNYYNIQGNYEGSLDKAQLQKKGITHILVAGKSLAKNFPKEFEYCELPLVDYTSQNLYPYIEEAVKFIKNGKIVFVHCAAGISRSSSMIIAYLMIEKGMSYDAAFELVKKKRPIIKPNVYFKAQLKKIDELLAKKEFDYKNLATLEIPEFSYY